MTIVLAKFCVFQPYRIGVIFSQPILDWEEGQIGPPSQIFCSYSKKHWFRMLKN